MKYDNPKRKPKVYTDLKEFQKAEQAYNDSTTYFNEGYYKLQWLKSKLKDYKYEDGTTANGVKFSTDADFLESYKQAYPKDFQPIGTFLPTHNGVESGGNITPYWKKPSSPPIYQKPENKNILLKENEVPKKVIKKEPIQVKGTIETENRPRLVQGTMEQEVRPPDIRQNYSSSYGNPNIPKGYYNEGSGNRKEFALGGELRDNTQVNKNIPQYLSNNILNKHRDFQESEYEKGKKLALEQRATNAATMEEMSRKFPKKPTQLSTGRAEDATLEVMDALSLISGVGYLGKKGLQVGAKGLAKGLANALKTKPKFNSEINLGNLSKEFPKTTTASSVVESATKQIAGSGNKYENYFKKLESKNAELQKLHASQKIDYETYNNLLENYKQELVKEVGLETKLGGGAYGEVFELANNPSKVVKLGRPMGNKWTPELIENLKSVKQNSNIAIPEEVLDFEIPSLYKGYPSSKKQVMIMPNLNKTGAQNLNLNKRDRYALFLKQARQLRDKGIELDVSNHENFKFNKDKNVFDLYDLNPGDVSSINPGYYMTHIRNNTKRRLLDDMMYKYGGVITTPAVGLGAGALQAKDKQVTPNFAYGGELNNNMKYTKKKILNGTDPSGNFTIPNSGSNINTASPSLVPDPYGTPLNMDGYTGTGLGKDFGTPKGIPGGQPSTGNKIGAGAVTAVGTGLSMGTDAIYAGNKENFNSALANNPGYSEGYSNIDTKLQKDLDITNKTASAIGTGLSFVNPLFGAGAAWLTGEIGKGMSHLSANKNKRKLASNSTVAYTDQQMNRGMQSNAYGGYMNGRKSFDNGGYMIPGNVTHENAMSKGLPEAGIPVGDNNLIESDEFLVNIGGKDYVFSRRLMFSKKTSFAQQAQRIQNKYKGREDKLSIESMQREFEALMNMQEQVRQTMEQESNAKSEKAFNRFAKKHGGFLNNVLAGGGYTTPTDSLYHQRDKTIKYDLLRGHAQGTPLPQYSNTAHYNQFYKDSVEPKLKYYSTAMEKGEAGDFIFNTGKDPRVFAYQEYLRKTDPTNKTGWADVDNKWKDRKNLPPDFDQIYQNTIGKLPENERRVAINNGRDWYYKNTWVDDNDKWKKGEGKEEIVNGKTAYRAPDGSLSSAYDKTWYGRIWNTNDYKEFNPNNPKFTPAQKAYGGFMGKKVLGEGGGVYDHLVNSYGNPNSNNPFSIYRPYDENYGFADEGQVNRDFAAISPAQADNTPLSKMQPRSATPINNIQGWDLNQNYLNTTLRPTDEVSYDFKEREPVTKKPFDRNAAIAAGLGVIPGVAGALYSLTSGKKKPYSLITPDLVNYSQAADAASREVQLATNPLIAGLRSSGLGKSAYLSQMANLTAGQQEKVGAIKAGLLSKQALDNVGIMNQARYANNEIRNRDVDETERFKDNKFQQAIMGGQSVADNLAYYFKDRGLSRERDKQIGNSEDLISSIDKHNYFTEEIDRFGIKTYKKAKT